MKGRNKVELGGNLVREPEVRYSPSKKKFALVDIAVNYSIKSVDESGQHNRVKKADYFRVLCSGWIADIVEKYCHKGSPVIFDARAVIRQFDKDGRHYWQIGFNATNITLCGSGQQEHAAADESQLPEELPDGAEDFPAGDFAEFGDDIYRQAMAAASKPA